MLSRGLSIAIFLLSVWRAATLSITIDEAYTYNEFVSQGFYGIFELYDANNHVLHSALAWLSTSVFGLSEFSLRIPALLGTALYLYCLLQLIERIFFAGHRWLRTLVYAVMICNPLTLDLLCAARGYSLALGFFAFALWRLVCYLERHQSRDLWWTSLALGLSTASNLAFLFAVIAALCVALCVVMKSGLLRRDLKSAMLPVAVVAIAVLGLPLSKADGNHFYWGATDIPESLRTTTIPFFQHHPVDPGPFGSAKVLGRFQRRFVPVAMLILLFATVHWLLSGERQPLTLVASIFAVTLFGYWLAHVRFGVPYPSERTGLPLVFFFFLTFGGAVSYLIRYRWAAALIAVPSALIFAAMLIQFAQQTDPRYLWAWHTDRDDRRIADILRGRGVKTASIHWTLQPSMEFYRRAGRIPSALQPFPKYQGENPPLKDHDAYVLSGPTDTRDLDVQYRNEATGVTVAFCVQHRP